jgi:hypothetical protein
MGFNERNQVSKLQLELSEMNGFLQLTTITMITLVTMWVSQKYQCGRPNEWPNRLNAALSLTYGK